MTKDLIKIKQASNTIEKILATKKITMPALYYYKLGRFYVKNGNFKEALPYFQKAVTLDSQKIKYRIGLGDCFYKLNRHKEALKYFQSIIKLDPSKTIAWCKRGVLENKLNKHAKALKTFQNRNISTSPCSKDCKSLILNPAKQI